VFNFYFFFLLLLFLLLNDVGCISELHQQTLFVCVIQVDDNYFIQHGPAADGMFMLSVDADCGNQVDIWPASSGAITKVEAQNPKNAPPNPSHRGAQGVNPYLSAASSASGKGNSIGAAGAGGSSAALQYKDISTKAPKTAASSRNSLGSGIGAGAGAIGGLSGLGGLGGLGGPGYGLSASEQQLRSLTEQYQLQQYQQNQLVMYFQQQQQQQLLQQQQLQQSAYGQQLYGMSLPPTRPPPQQQQQWNDYHPASYLEREDPQLAMPLSMNMLQGQHTQQYGLPLSQQQQQQLLHAQQYPGSLGGSTASMLSMGGAAAGAGAGYLPQGYGAGGGGAGAGPGMDFSAARRYTGALLDMDRGGVSIATAGFSQAPTAAALAAAQGPYGVGGPHHPLYQPQYSGRGETAHVPGSSIGGAGGGGAATSPVPPQDMLLGGGGALYAGRGGAAGGGGAGSGGSGLVGANGLPPGLLLPPSQAQTQVQTQAAATSYPLAASGVSGGGVGSFAAGAAPAMPIGVSSAPAHSQQQQQDIILPLPLPQKLSQKQEGAAAPSVQAPVSGPVNEDTAPVPSHQLLQDPARFGEKQGSEENAGGKNIGESTTTRSSKRRRP
jgi:hypothetical protein